MPPITAHGGKLTGPFARAIHRGYRGRTHGSIAYQRKTAFCGGAGFQGLDSLLLGYCFSPGNGMARLDSIHDLDVEW